MLLAPWALALVALPLRSGAVRKAAAGHRLVPMMPPGGVPPSFVQPPAQTHAVVVPQASAPLPSAITRETQPASPLRDGAAAYVADAATRACPSEMTMTEPPATFASSLALSFLDGNGLPSWFHTTPGCEDGSVLKTLQVADQSGQAATKLSTTFCKDGHCWTKIATGSAVELPQRLKGWKDEGATLTLVSREGADGAYEEVEYLRHWEGGEWTTRAQRTSLPAPAEAPAARGAGFFASSGGVLVASSDLAQDTDAGSPQPVPAADAEIAPGAAARAAVQETPRLVDKSLAASSGASKIADMQEADTAPVDWNTAMDASMFFDYF